MKRHSRLLIAGAALILAGNAVVLVGVAYNRSGEPEAVVELSERELFWPYNQRASVENSGLALRLRWRVGKDRQSIDTGIVLGGVTAPWLNKDKLAELGFDVSVSPQDGSATTQYEKTLQREAYVVLEFDGPAYQAVVQQRLEKVVDAQALLDRNPGQKEFIERVKTYQAQLERELHNHSRLFAVDLGPDLASLRSRYPDRASHLIIPGQVRLTLRNNQLNGYITDLSITTVNLSLHERLAIIDGAPGRPAHYSVRLAIGKRAEPWILEARAVKPAL